MNQPQYTTKDHILVWGGVAIVTIATLIAMYYFNYVR